MKFENKQLEDYNFDRILGIIESLYYLKGEAKETGNEDIENLILSTFNMLIITYNIIMREEKSKFLAEEFEKKRIDIALLPKDNSQ